MPEIVSIACENYTPLDKIANLPRIRGYGIYPPVPGTGATDAYNGAACDTAPRITMGTYRAPIEDMSFLIDELLDE